MFAVRNSTKYQAQPAVLTDRDGRDVVVVVAKGTFQVSPSGVVSLAGEQVPLVFADEYLGDPGQTSLKAACDMVLFKPRTDVIVLGQAHSPQGEPITQMDVELRVGDLQKRLRVMGNRRWEKRLMSLTPTEPEPFQKMPLSFERAFGGRCPVAAESEEEQQDDRNPVGVGYVAVAEQSVDKPLPNLEDPAALISTWKDRPDPRAFGYVCGHWQPRRAFAGTYDDRWQRERMPLLPDDFDYRFFNVAPLDQQLPGYLVGGERVELRGFTPDGEFSFELPQDKVGVNLLFPMEVERAEPAVLDTLIIEPDLRRFQLVWRAKFSAPDPLTHLLHMDVTSRLHSVVHPVVWPHQDEEPFDDK